MVSSTLILAALQGAQAWQPWVGYSDAAFVLTESTYDFVDESCKVWKDEQTITPEAAAAQCLKHGEDCVGFFREDKDGAAHTGYVPAICAMKEAGLNIDNCENCTHAFYNRTFQPANGKVKTDYMGQCLEAVPVAEGVMNITSRPCAPTSFQRWSLNYTMLVYDGGVGRSMYVGPAKDADWQGAELFVWDANLFPVPSDFDVKWEYTADHQLKLNSKWHHSCAFTDSAVGGSLMLWDCNYSPAQQWTLGLMNYEYYFDADEHSWSNSSNDSAVALGSKYSESVKGKIELSDSADAGTGLCLHAAKANDGQQLSLKKCDTATTWSLDYSLESYGRGGSRVNDAQLSIDGKCITTPGNDRTNGEIMWLWDCNDLSTDDHYQHGALSYYGQISEGQVLQVRSFVHSSDGSWSCADVTGDYVEGTLMQVWDCDSLGTNANQEFVWWNMDAEVEV
jgi:hypothetical protein